MDFNEIDYLVEGFLYAAATGIFIGFVVWCVRMIIKAFRKIIGA